MNVDPDAQVSLPAGEGDLAVAAAFAAGADDSAFGARPSAGAPAGDRSDTDSDADSDDDSDADAPPSGAPEFEFSDEETRRRIPGVIRDGSDSSEWSDSSDDEDVEELDLENMPKWLEDIKNGVKSDFDDDAAHSEPPRTKNEIAADAVPPPLPPPHVGPDEPSRTSATSHPWWETPSSCNPSRARNPSTRNRCCASSRDSDSARWRRCSGPSPRRSTR